MAKLTRVTDWLVKWNAMLVGSVERLLGDKLEERLSTLDFGAKGDGITSDEASFQLMENVSAGVIYGLGKTYKVDTLPVSLKYADGFFLYQGELIEFPLTSYFRGDRNVIAIGPNALGSRIGARNCIAIGQDALGMNTFGRHNIAIGLSAGHYLNGLSSSDISGSRNILIGGNTGRFMVDGSRNIIMGRDAGHNLTSAHLNLIFGSGAVMGWGPNTLDPGVIENQTPLTPSFSLMFGTEAGKFWNAGYGTAFGHNALQNVKSDAGMVGIGAFAFAKHQSDLSYWGTLMNTVTLSGTYSQGGAKTITIACTAHGMSTGFRALVRFTTGANADTTYMDDNWFVVTVIDANNFTIQSPVNATASGNLTISLISTLTPYATLTGGCVGVGREVGNGNSNYRSTGIGHLLGSKGLGVENTGMGYNVWMNYVAGAGCTAMGAYSQQSNNNAGGNTSFGVLTMAGGTLTGLSNAAFGPQAMRFVTTGSNNAAFGGNSLRGLTTGNYNSAFGPDALRYAFGSTTDAHNFSNCTGLGYQAYCSGDNQVQVGGVGTSVYTYSAVQIRSDKRDKADEVEITFEVASKILKLLRPLFYKYDYRDSYFDMVDTGEVEDVGNGEVIPMTKRVAVPKDGSRKGSRLHAGFFAQDIKEALESCGIDFGVFQDHSINGGADVMSVAYEELIPIMVKCQSVVLDKVESIEGRLAALESK